MTGTSKLAGASSHPSTNAVARSCLGWAARAGCHVSRAKHKVGRYEVCMPLAGSGVYNFLFAYNEE
eukprot:38634-Chlamydomonas_euryale.AAC.2